MSSSSTMAAADDGVGEVPLGVAGLYGWRATFEDVLHNVGARISELGSDDNGHFVRFPPVIPRETIDRVRYQAAFPHLLGDVTVWDRASEADPVFRPSAVVLTPAACYHVYPLASTTQDPPGESFEIECWCFRNEAADDVGRLSAFRMREFVRVGDPATVYRWREAWVERVHRFLTDLGLEARVAPATDPFFGARGKLLAARQHAQETKYELLAPVAGGKEGAVASVNYHHDHFGDLFALKLPTGDPAHTACAAFGLERLTTALFSKHGRDIAVWPRDVQKALRGPVR